MKRILILLYIYTPIALFSQVASISTDARQSLNERFLKMKSSSQTFKEYKVINEVTLDKEWKIISDSVALARRQWREAKSAIARLEGELKTIQLTLQEKEKSTAKIEYDASHIDFFGISFNKTFFVAMVIIAVATLVVLLGLMAGRLKILFKGIREKNETVEMISREFEEYKHKMLDKQTKLSRELQNERNRLQELKRI